MIDRRCPKCGEIYSDEACPNGCSPLPTEQLSSHDDKDKRIAELEEGLNELQIEIASLHGNHRWQLEERNNEIESLKARILELEAQEYLAAHLKGQLETEAGRTADLRLRLEDATIRNSSLYAKLEERNDEIETLRKRQTALSSNSVLRYVEAEIKRLKAELEERDKPRPGAAAKRIAELTDDYNGVLAKYVGAKQRIEELKTENERLKREIADSLRVNAEQYVALVEKSAAERTLKAEGGV